ncbi:chorismate-binding protein, partial [Mycobacterium tuberculosis]|nr:chorismate-binding protein [Mycobacterium tuberculosis]
RLVPSTADGNRWADVIATVQAGAGIVLDSVPQSEADETRNKARAVLRAIAQAHHAKEIF